MRLLIIRHGIAEDAPPDGADADRRLTPAGIRKMERGARGIRRLVPTLDIVATSPLVRATQTAEIVAAEYDGLAVTEAAVLSPGGPPEAVAAWLARESSAETIALVGHEPGLSRLVSWLIAGELKSVVEMKKGAACLLECPAEVEAGSGTLLWLLRSRHLRRLK